MTVRELLSDQYHYMLPRFQRHYAWTPSVASRLFDDIQEARNLEKPGGDPRIMFIGAIIVILNAENTTITNILNGRNNARYEIIDGQQRLVTLTLLLCVIRDALKGQRRAAIDKVIAGAAQADFAWRLTLRNIDEQWFSKFAKNIGGTRIDPSLHETSDTARNLMLNRDLFSEELASMTRDEIYEFAQFILDDCQVALIEADNHDDAHQIYESLNHSGVPLHRSNHIKSRTFRGWDENDPKYNALAEKWDSWERKLGIARFDRLFSIIRAIHGSASQPIVLENQKIIARVGGGENYLNEIVQPAVVGYQRLADATNGVGDDNPEISRLLAYLNWMKDTDWLGPVIKWFQLGPEDDTSTIEFLRRLDRLAFGLLIKGTNNVERTRRFKAVLNDIDATGLPQGRSSIDLSKKEQERILFRISNDFQRIAGRACKLVLLRVSDVMGNTLTRRVPSGLSIEHVLPRTIRDDSPWHAVYPSKLILDRCFRRFANMALLPTDLNQRINNMSFEDKKFEVFGPDMTAPTLTPWALTNRIVDCGNWSVETIERQEDELIAVIREMWDLKGRGGRELDRGAD